MILTVKGKAAAIVQDAESYQRLLDIAARADAVEGIRQGWSKLRLERAGTPRNSSPSSRPRMAYRVKIMPRSAIWQAAPQSPWKRWVRVDPATLFATDSALAHLAAFRRAGQTARQDGPQYRCPLSQATQMVNILRHAGSLQKRWRRATSGVNDKAMKGSMPPRDQKTNH